MIYFSELYTETAFIHNFECIDTLMELIVEEVAKITIPVVLSVFHLFYLPSLFEIYANNKP